MKETQTTPVNFSFFPAPKSDELTPTQRRQANKGIDGLLKEHRGKRIIDLLPMIKRRFPGIILKVALERVERRQDELNIEDAMFLANFKQSLAKNE